MKRGYLSYVAVGLASAVVGGLVVGLVMVNSLEWRQEAAPGIPAPPEGGQVPPSAHSLEGDRVVEVAETVSRAVVRITKKVVVYDWFSRRSRLDEVGSGSGVIFSGDGYIVTNNHVVEGAHELTVTLADGRNFPGEIVGADAVTDLAVVRIGAKELAAARFGDSDKLRVGEVAIAIGNPLGFERTVTVGVISGTNRLLRQGEQEFRLIHTDAAINPGNSGGPLVNINGDVVGINTIKVAAEEVEGMGFAIPINDVRRTVSELIKYGRVIRPWLGVGVLDREVAQEYGIELDKGVLVVTVAPGSPGERAGLLKGDVVIALDGQEVNNGTELRQGIRQKKVGDKLELTILRRGKRQVLLASLTEMPSQ